jgi:outer membrane lipoprotein-sorting protein
MIEIQKYIYTAILLFLIFFTGPKTSGQELDPYDIMERVKMRLDSVHDYSAMIEIEVDVDFIRMPTKNAQIFFKKPDKMKIKSDDFIMLPKRGLNNKLAEMLNEPYTAIYLGKEEAEPRNSYLIRIVPTSRNPEIVLASLWIDPVHYRILKSESNTKKEGSFVVDLLYSDPEDLLPSEMIFTFEIEKLSLPLTFIGKSAGMDIDRSKMEKVQEGKVYIRFSDYRINENLPDLFFEEQQSDENGS